MKVVDTSVAVKWFFNEEGSNQAKALLNSEELIAPDLLLYELTNVLICQKYLTASDVRLFLEKLNDFGIQFFVLPQRDFLKVAELSMQFGITAYDASFVLLAQKLKTSLITADEKLVRKVKSLPFVQGLKIKN